MSFILFFFLVLATFIIWRSLSDFLHSISLFPRCCLLSCSTESPVFPTTPLKRVQFYKQFWTCCKISAFQPMQCFSFMNSAGEKKKTHLNIRLLFTTQTQNLISCMFVTSTGSEIHLPRLNLSCMKRVVALIGSDVTLNARFLLSLEISCCIVITGSRLMLANCQFNEGKNYTTIIRCVFMLAWGIS